MIEIDLLCGVMVRCIRIIHFCFVSCLHVSDTTAKGIHARKCKTTEQAREQKKNRRKCEINDSVWIIWIKYEVMGDDEKLLPIIQCTNETQIEHLYSSIVALRHTIRFDLDCLLPARFTPDDKTTLSNETRPIFTCFSTKYQISHKT